MIPPPTTLLVAGRGRRSAGGPGWTILAALVTALACGEPQPGTPGGPGGGTDAGNAQVDGGAPDAGGSGVDGGGGNLAPLWGALNPITVAEGALASVPLSATDPDGDPLDFTLQNAPSWASLFGPSLRLNPSHAVVASSAPSASVTLTLRVSDGRHAPVETTVAVLVTAVNRAPTLGTLTDVAMTAGTTETVTVSASDPDGDAVVLSLGSGAPAWASFSGSTVTLSPPTSVSGVSMVTVEASDDALSPLGASDWFSVTVSAPLNQPPTLSDLAQLTAADAGVSPGVTVTAPPKLRGLVADPEADDVKLEAEVISTGASFSGTPTHSGSLSPQGVVELPLTGLSPGTYKWQLRASDAQSNTSPFSQFNAGATAFTLAQATVTGAVVIANGAAFTAQQTVSLELSAASNGGAVTQMRFSTNGGATFGQYEAFATTRSFVLPAGDGQKTVTVEFQDANGNSGRASASIGLDTIDPTLSSAQLNGGAAWTNGATVTVTVDAADGAGGAGLELICVSGSGVSAAACKPYSGAGAQFTLSPFDGAKSISVTVKDGAGRASTAQVLSIGVDTSPPTVSAIAINAGAASTGSTSVSIETTATDSSGGSGVNRVLFANDSDAYGTNFLPWTSGTPNAHTLANAAGERTVRAKVRDAAGNLSTSEATDTITLATGADGGVCRESGGAAPNLLDNPGFECGSPPLAWDPGFFGTLSVSAGRTGAQAGRFTASTTPSDPQTRYVLSSTGVTQASPSQFVCASAYVRGTGQNAVLRIVRLGSNVKDDFAQPLTATWARIDHVARMQSNDTGAQFAVGLRGPDAGHYLDVDDAQLWISGQPDGGCGER